MLPAASTIESIWPLPLLCEYIDGIDWRIAATFAFLSPAPTVPDMSVPGSFVTDFASIPRFFWRVLHPTHKWIARGAVIHDWIYRNPAIAVSRKQADQLLVACMKVLGAPWWARSVVYATVRMCGSKAYKPRTA